MNHLLIDALRLRERLHETVVFDCRFSLADHDHGRRCYEEGHVPGAQRLDMETDLAGPKTGDNGRHPLPTLVRFQSTLREAGVDDHTHIVLYDANRLAGSARAWWLMRHYGLQQVRILDGGLAAWREAGGELTPGPPAPARPGTVSLCDARRDELIGREALLEALSRNPPAIVDAREPARWAGREEPIDPVAGRIPGAVNLPWLEVTDERGRVVDPTRLCELWRDAGDDPIVYCGSGVTASVLLLSRALAKQPGGRLYAGSWSEWCMHTDCPVERDPDA